MEQKVSLSDFSMEKLRMLIIKSYSNSVDIDGVDKMIAAGLNENALPHTDADIRYKEEKLSFLMMLFNPDQAYLHPMRNNVIEDYMSGLHLYISSNYVFHYGFGMFKDKMVAFNKWLDDWYKFLDAVIEDVKTLPKIELEQPIVLVFDDFLSLNIQGQFITSAEIDLCKFNLVFSPKSEKYRFGIYLRYDDKKKKQLLLSGKCDGKGNKGAMSKDLVRINELVSKIKDYQKLQSFKFIKAVHENEFA